MSKWVDYRDGINLKEKQLVLRAVKGDQAAFEDLVSENARFIYNLALRMLKNPQEAEDLSQEVFIRVWKALPKFRAEANFRTWLYRIVINLCYDRLPKLRTELEALDPDEESGLLDENDTPESAALTEELREELYYAIERLPESYNLLITLRHLQEMSYAEIAEVTGQPLGTVKTGIFRARRLLYDTIQVYETEHE